MAACGARGIYFECSSSGPSLRAARPSVAHSLTALEVLAVWVSTVAQSPNRRRALVDGQGEDWVKETIDSWRHSIWVGVWSPWFVMFKGPIVWYKTVREIVTLERMHRAFDRGLMTYGMIKGTKSGATTVAQTGQAGEFIR
jgi:hypothetical protein